MRISIRVNMVLVQSYIFSWSQYKAIYCHFSIIWGLNFQFNRFVYSNVDKNLAVDVLSNLHLIDAHL
jgi:hypothetical protein